MSKPTTTHHKTVAVPVSMVAHSYSKPIRLGAKWHHIIRAVGRTHDDAAAPPGMIFVIVAPARGPQ